MKHHHQQDGISLDNPQYKGRAQEIASMPGLQTILLTDGTHTLAQLIFEDIPIATGHAKRKLGDRKDSELGATLALSRMFHAASKVYSHKASHILNPPKDDAREEALEALPEELRAMMGLPNKQEEAAVARMDKITKQNCKELKNERRRSARVKFFQEKNPDASDIDLVWWLSETFGDNDPLDV